MLDSLLIQFLFELLALVASVAVDVDVAVEVAQLNLT
jgi:hypothetical protein